MVVHPYNKAQNSQGQKIFHKRFIPETLKSTQLVNHRNNPFISHDSYFPRIMIVPISESNPKIQCQYVLLKAKFYFFYIFYIFLYFFCFFFVFFNQNFFLIKTNKKQN